eukprot:TRINITY_DN9203_c0_g1_i1.p1 TRINITY_DN9203_c0_g1~~TRINITY_DN9203_c0_g1_i1.p1  ORF type:complete len:437 (+),score=160.01 TRINITY_DN9203_c0_g1_i1:60-1370(+)
MTTFDVCVIGLGATGAAAAYELAARGHSVVAVEQYGISHDKGSSHGEARVLRLPYFEGAHYVPLVKRSLEKWRGIEEAIGGAPGSLFKQTGTLDIGKPDGIVRDAIQSCKEYAIEHEVLSGNQVRERFPALEGVDDAFMACYQKDGGVLHPERCVAAMVDLAKQKGARICTDTKVYSYHVTSDAPSASGAAAAGRSHAYLRKRVGKATILVNTSRGGLQCRKLVIATGAWTAQLCPDVARRAALQPERQVVGWFSNPPVPKFTPAQLPVFVIEDEGRAWYGFPSNKGEEVQEDFASDFSYAKASGPQQVDATGVKIGLYRNPHGRVTPEDVDRTPSDADIAALRPPLAKFLPEANGDVTRTTTCLFTMSRDSHFVVDRAPSFPDVVVGCGFSGHGFKFAPVVGELLADLVDDEEGVSTQYAGRHFSLERFAGDAKL